MQMPVDELLINDVDPRTGRTIAPVEGASFQDGDTERLEVPSAHQLIVCRPTARRICRWVARNLERLSNVPSLERQIVGETDHADTGQRGEGRLELPVERQHLRLRWIAASRQTDVHRQ